MKARRFTALTAFLSFSVMLVTSLILFVTPQGRIAYWADWTLAGLNKEQWSAIHVNAGFLFLATLLFHIYLNWRAITLYLKNRAQQFKLFTPEFNAALLLVCAFVVGTYADIPPFSSIQDLGEVIKENAADTYGEPPYGHAERSSFASFSEKMGLNAAQSMERITQAGYAIHSDQQTIQEIARQNGLSPQQLLHVMAPELGVTDTSKGRLSEAPAGLGRLSLLQLCEKYELDVTQIKAGLMAQGLAVDETQRLKDIADAHGLNPHDLFEKIKVLAEPQ